MVLGRDVNIGLPYQVRHVWSFGAHKALMELSATRTSSLLSNFRGCDPPERQFCTAFPDPFSSPASDLSFFRSGVLNRPEDRFSAMDVLCHV
jgi:hypothetical protein